jgi:very-short-patch-repair endonuclease
MDADRTPLLNESGISIFRFTNEEIIHQTKLLLEK